MVWSLQQRQRLAIEKEKLEEYFRFGVVWIDPQNETKVEICLKSNRGKAYTLRIYIPFDFPSSCPPLVVASPRILYLNTGIILPESSSAFHTLPNYDGLHRVCHFYPPDWTPDITLFQVVMKGRIWIEAYEAHLETGENMDAFLKEQLTPSPSSSGVALTSAVTRVPPSVRDRQQLGNPSNSRNSRNSRATVSNNGNIVNNNSRNQLSSDNLAPTPRTADSTAISGTGSTTEGARSSPSVRPSRYRPGGGVDLFHSAIHSEMLRRNRLSREGNVPQSQ